MSKRTGKSNGPPSIPQTISTDDYRGSPEPLTFNTLPSPSNGAGEYPNHVLLDGQELGRSSRDELLSIIQDLQSRLQCAEDKHNSMKQWLRDTLGLVAQQQLLILRLASQPTTEDDGLAAVQSDMKTRFEPLQTPTPPSLSSSSPKQPPFHPLPPTSRSDAEKRSLEGLVGGRRGKKHRPNSPSVNVSTDDFAMGLVDAYNGLS